MRRAADQDPLHRGGPKGEGHSLLGVQRARQVLYRRPLLPMGQPSPPAGTREVQTARPLRKRNTLNLGQVHVEEKWN